MPPLESAVAVHPLGESTLEQLPWPVDTPGAAYFQPVTQVNYPNEHEYLRITEFRHLAGQPLEFSTLSYEFPADDGDPYYPIPRPENRALYKRYEALAETESDVYFIGRLAQYRYLNMDQIVAGALHASERLQARPTAH